MEILPFLGAAFGIMIVGILVVGAIGKSRKRRKLVKQYGVPFVPGEGDAEKEALEDKAGLSASGGVDSDKFWDDDVEPMELSAKPQEEPSGFDDIDIREGNVTQNSDVMEESSSIEELAGLPPQSTVADMEIRNQAPEGLEEPVTPPLPDSGLPDGWTMDQWKWYGAQWLENQK